MGEAALGPDRAVSDRGEDAFDRHSPVAVQIRGKSYHSPSAKGAAPLPQPSDGLILEIGPRLECHLSGFSVIQTQPSCRFHLADVAVPRELS